MSDSRKYITGEKFGTAVLDALGVPTKGVTRVTIDCKLHDVVRVYVSRVGTEALFDITLPDAHGVEIIDTGASQ